MPKEGLIYGCARVSADTQDLSNQVAQPKVPGIYSGRPPVRERKSRSREFAHRARGGEELQTRACGSQADNRGPAFV